MSNREFQTALFHTVSFPRFNSTHTTMSFLTGTQGSYQPPLSTQHAVALHDAYSAVSLITLKFQIRSKHSFPRSDRPIKTTFSCPIFRIPRFKIVKPDERLLRNNKSVMRHFQKCTGRGCMSFARL